jgi:hypothetical protein
MMCVRSLAALGAAATVLLAAAAPADAQSLAGKWSADQQCGVEARQIVFRGNTMELWDQNQRLFSGNVRFSNSGSETQVTVTGISRDTPRRAGMPAVGDVASFRRDGDRMFPVAVTSNGDRRAAPDNVPPFYLCR